jgi:transposase
VPREIDLGKLSHAEKDAIILSLLPLVGQLEAALARIAELEARLALLERPAKTPDNASRPPSKGQKSDQPADGAKPPRRSRPGFGRALEPNPDRIVDRPLGACPHCAAAWPAAPQAPPLVHDRIEPPPIKPDVTRVRLFGGRCACCGERAIAAAPAGLEPGSPFGRSIEALVVYLHCAQAIGIERLRCVLAEPFGLSISEGALCNTLARVPHIIRPSRGAAVLRGLFGAMRPRVWVSDSPGSQRGHADPWQVCLAHLLRDAQHAIDCGDEGFSAALKRLLLRAIAIGRRRGDPRDTTPRQCRADLDRRLDRVLALPRRGKAAEKLRRRVARDRDHLFVFVTDRDVPATNNVSERALRPSVIFRKVTNGFRSEWGAHTYAAFRSVVSTAKVNNRSVLDDLRRVLATASSSDAAT